MTIWYISALECAAFGSSSPQSSSDSSSSSAKSAASSYWSENRSRSLARAQAGASINPNHKVNFVIKVVALQTRLDMAFL